MRERSALVWIAGFILVMALGLGLAACGGGGGNNGGGNNGGGPSGDTLSITGEPAYDGPYVAPGTPVASDRTFTEVGYLDEDGSEIFGPISTVIGDSSVAEIKDGNVNIRLGKPSMMFPVGTMLDPDAIVSDPAVRILVIESFEYGNGMGALWHENVEIIGEDIFFLYVEEGPLTITGLDSTGNTWNVNAHTGWNVGVRSPNAADEMDFTVPGVPGSDHKWIFYDAS